jgi:hypothetical protein
VECGWTSKVCRGCRHIVGLPLHLLLSVGQESQVICKIEVLQFCP